MTHRATAQYETVGGPNDGESFPVRYKRGQPLTVVALADGAYRLEYADGHTPNAAQVIAANINHTITGDNTAMVWCWYPA